MEPVLFDTTVWIDYLKGVVRPQTDLLNQYITHDEPVFVCPTVVQEILQGIRSDEQFQQVRQSLLGFPCLLIPGLDAALAAAELYRDLRKKGITIRKANDCLIAAYALHFDMAVCHNDSDFSMLALHIGLKEKLYL
ncbi:MAG: PIN domain-containing protein [Cytophagaceae bacterium]|nr:PIN domain-containing protein [Cytophagaceae bacterium]